MNVCVVKTATGLTCLCFTSGKSVTVSGFLLLLSSIFSYSVAVVERQAVMTYIAILDVGFS